MSNLQSRIFQESERIIESNSIIDGNHALNVECDIIMESSKTI